MKFPGRPRSGQAELSVVKPSAHHTVLPLRTGHLQWAHTNATWVTLWNSVKYWGARKLHLTELSRFSRRIENCWTSLQCPCLLPCGPNVSVQWSDWFSIALLVSIAKSGVLFFFLICNLSYKVTLWFTSNTDAEGCGNFLKLSSSTLFTGFGYCR